jgi:hypothetical protein
MHDGSRNWTKDSKMPMQIFSRMVVAIFQVSFARSLKSSCRAMVIRPTGVFGMKKTT